MKPVMHGAKVANGTVTVSIEAMTRLASAVRHAEEYMDTGNPVDEGTFRSLASDPEVLAVMNKLDDLAMLPVKR